MVTKVHSLAVFRILFGLLMMAAMLRFMANGWVEELFLRPEFHFPYPGFGWIRPWPGEWMYWHVLATAACALGVAIGYHYRICIVLFFAGFTWLELIDQTTYLNHYYLVSLVAGLMVFMPAHRAWSLDTARKPSLRSDFIPAWPVNLLRFQFAIVYLFAGVAKLNADWLLEAQPLRIWLAACSDLPLIGPLLEQAWVAYAASWFGALYDLSVPFLLMFSRTRPLAFVAVVFFHVLTWLLFPIGMFPWIMIAGATLFFPSDWPILWSAAFSRLVGLLRATKVVQDFSPFFRSPPKSGLNSATTFSTGARSTRHFEKPGDLCVKPRPPAWGKVLLGIHVAIQILLPARAWWMDGNSAWTGDGFNWAWKVMIVEKRGTVAFIARDGNKTWRIDPREYLTSHQVVMMAQDPYLIRSFARFLARDSGADIRTDAFVTLNGRPSQRIIDPAVNLAGPSKPGWIIPLIEPPAPPRAGTPAVAHSPSR